MQPVLTIFCAFTRRWAVDRWLENLEGVEHDPALTNLCIIIDGNEPYILNRFKKLVEEKGYRGFEWKMNEEWHPNEVRLKIRRQRVADIKNQSKDLIARVDGDIIICFEDDTVFDRLKSFYPLYNPLYKEDGSPSNYGFVEGVQMGRWGANIIGAWWANDPLIPTEIKTLLPPSEADKPNMPSYPFRGISGGGFYGYATRRDLYLNHEYYTATSQPWGPDVNYGLWLKSRGYQCLINWEVVFGHNDHGTVGWPEDHRLVEITYKKDALIGRWNRTDNEQTRY